MADSSSSSEEDVPGESEYGSDEDAASESSDDMNALLAVEDRPYHGAHDSPRQVRIFCLGTLNVAMITCEMTCMCVFGEVLCVWFRVKCRVSPQCRLQILKSWVDDLMSARNKTRESAVSVETFTNMKKFAQKLERGEGPSLEEKAAFDALTMDVHDVSRMLSLRHTSMASCLKYFMTSQEARWGEPKNNKVVVELTGSPSLQRVFLSKDGVLPKKVECENMELAITSSFVELMKSFFMFSRFRDPGASMYRENWPAETLHDQHKHAALALEEYLALARKRASSGGEGGSSKRAKISS